MRAHFMMPSVFSMNNDERLRHHVHVVDSGGPHGCDDRQRINNIARGSVYFATTFICDNAHQYSNEVRNRLMRTDERLVATGDLCVYNHTQRALRYSMIATFPVCDFNVEINKPNIDALAHERSEQGEWGERGEHWRSPYFTTVGSSIEMSVSSLGVVPFLLAELS